MACRFPIGNRIFALNKSWTKTLLVGLEYENITDKEYTPIVRILSHDFKGVSFKLREWEAFVDCFDKIDKYFKGAISMKDGPIDTSTGWSVQLTRSYDKRAIEIVEKPQHESSVETEKQTAEYLLERLIEEESLLVADEEETVALAASTVLRKKRQGKLQGTNHKKDVECYHCHDKGHFARNCPRRQNKSEGRTPNSSPNVAFVAEKSLEDRSNTKVSPLDCRKLNLEQEKKLLEAPAADIWVADSRASAHATHNRNWLTNYQPSKEGKTITLGDEGECAVVGEDTVVINRLLNGEWHEALIGNVWYVPKLKKNLFSIGQITSKGYAVNFMDAYVKMKKDDK
uniref:CCHC-type domain-containing protein n=1 Tax=Trichogramma kaykai TaxID=54128 RepID=A0ABD2W2D7_9HYME